MSGRDSIIILLLAAALTGDLIFAYLGHRQLSDEHQAFLRELQVQSWLLSLPAEKRPELVPPDHVWERVLVYQRYFEDLRREKGREAQKK